jgi:beta-lactamase superfamily II metal-dependent hydrolase
VGEVPVPESLVEGTFRNDDSKVNSSSIIFLAEYDNKCCLFTGDGILGATRFPGRGVPLMPGSGRIRFDALKVPHHGSKGNLSTSFLESIECRAYLFSSNGTRHGHPDRETVARILMANGFRDENNSITLHFNYKTPCNEIWANTNLKKDYNYRTVYSGQAFDL